MTGAGRDSESRFSGAAGSKPVQSPEIKSARGTCRLRMPCREDAASVVTLSNALEGLRPVFFGPSEQVWEISIPPEGAFSTVRILRQRAALDRSL